MNKYGLIGHPIAHSLSPALFKAAYEGRYPYDLIEGEDFEASYRRFLEEYTAINVTAPFKELAFAKADVRSQGCEATGAANILFKNNDGCIEAANSDIAGVIGALTCNADLTRTRPYALVVGCGGAAMAAAYALGSLGYHTTIINRSLPKAEVVAGRISKALSAEIHAAGLEDFRRLFRKAGVIVYSLPIALKALDELSVRDIKGCIIGDGHHKILLEANYRDPSVTPKMTERFQRINPHFTCIDGKEWLLYQAIEAYRIFTSEEPDAEAMRKVVG